MIGTLSPVAVKVASPAMVELTAKVTTPLVLETPEVGEMVSGGVPRLETSDTVLPWTAVPLASFKVTVIVEVSLPLAVTELGSTATVELAALTAPASKVTVAVDGEMTRLLSLTSVAVKVAEPDVEDFTLKVTTPEPEEGPEAAEIVSTPSARLEARVTVLPATGLLLASRKVTVMVEVVVPSLATVVGKATTVELAASATTGAVAA